MSSKLRKFIHVIMLFLNGIFFSFIATFIQFIIWSFSIESLINLYGLLSIFLGILIILTNGLKVKMEFRIIRIIFQYILILYSLAVISFFFYPSGIIEVSFCLGVIISTLFNLRYDFDFSENY